MASAPGKLLNVDQIRSLFSGARTKGRSFTTGNPMSIHYKANGTFSGETTRGLNAVFFDGTWRIKQPNEWCFKTRRRSGCRTIRHVGGDEYEFLGPDGPVGRATITK